MYVRSPKGGNIPLPAVRLYLQRYTLYWGLQNLYTKALLTDLVKLHTLWTVDLSAFLSDNVAFNHY